MTRLRLVAGIVVTLLVTTACTGLPESGPVVDVNVPSAVDDERPSDYNPAPPVSGASQTDIVKGFLDANTASPIRTDVAREYLSTSARAEWDPEDSTITYPGQVQLRGEGLTVTVPLTDAERLDRSGAWKGRLSASEQEMEFQLTVEDGEYRIVNPPDALLVPTSWFAQRFRQASLYFFDPSARILVPEPVFVPRGEQLASALISSLLAGPGESLRGVARSFLPPGLSVQVSVPVSADGVADITLLGEPGTQTAAATDKMLAQLAWTLRQEPTIRALRVTIADEVVRTPSGGDEYAVDEAGAYDPNVASASDEIFALRDGRLTQRNGNELVPVPGVFGAGDYDLRAAAVNLDATQAAAVSVDGRELFVSELGGGTGADGVEARRPLLGTDLLRPAWDFADRVWVVDRTARGAVVQYFVDGRRRRIEVPGVSGEQVRRFLVSRDGTRFIAVVRGPGVGDQLRVGRIEVDDRGVPSRISQTTDIVRDPDLPVRIKDIAWVSPTAVALLTAVAANEIFEVRTVSVDGSATGTESLTTTVAELVTGLVGSPDPAVATYVVTPTNLIDLADRAPYAFVDGQATSVGYVG